MVRQTKHSDLRHIKVYVDMDNRVYVDDDNTWEQPRGDCVNIYWKDHIWQVENENTHTTGNLIYHLAFHGQSRTWMKTSLYWMDHMRARKPNSNGMDPYKHVGYFQRLWFDFYITLPCEIGVRLTAILAINTMRQLDYTREKGSEQQWFNRHWRQHEMNSQMLMNGKWNYDK